ncbi:hypothetical protein HanIR_Chr02g0082311 [Helianthus annuus]|nr:hypothetical protein HanIR_Chr02g0082311 [Helianthus annuus]
MHSSKVCSSLLFCRTALLPFILISCEAFNVIIILCNSIVPLSISTSVSSQPILRRGSMKSTTKLLLYFPITRI